MARWITVQFHGQPHYVAAHKRTFSARHDARLDVPEQLAMNLGYAGESSGLSAAPANLRFDGQVLRPDLRRQTP
jgi:hypothetical protein